jgi:hypothetical protein
MLVLPLVLKDGKITVLQRGDALNMGVLPTFIVNADLIATASNKDMVSIYVDALATRKISIRSIKIINERIVNVTSVDLSFYIRRFTGFTGGTGISSVSMDTNDTLVSGISAQTNATLTGVATTYFKKLVLASDEVARGSNSAADAEEAANQLGRLISVYSPGHYETPITALPGEGITFRCETNNTTGIFSIEIIYTMEEL